MLPTNAKEDPKNLQILEDRVRRHNERTGPRVGDWVRRPDGTETRITYIWDFEDGNWHLQDGGTYGGSYYLNQYGGLSYSGSLDPSYPASTLRLLPETKPGLVWFFDQDFPRAHAGISYEIEERVFLMEAGNL